MAINTILSKGRSDKVLKYILEASTFSDQEYELLVTNSNVKNQEYFIPLIKYKFNPIEFAKGAQDAFQQILDAMYSPDFQTFLKSLNEFINIGI